MSTRLTHFRLSRFLTCLVSENVHSILVYVGLYLVTAAQIHLLYPIIITRNSPEDEIANVNFFTTTSYTH